MFAKFLRGNKWPTHVFRLRTTKAKGVIEVNTTNTNSSSETITSLAERSRGGWIGVDLDGTLAKSVVAETGKVNIGPPIDPMVQLVRDWLAQGEDVRIFTARVNPHQHPVDASLARTAIEVWCERHLGQILPVTHEKDWNLVLLFDDRARQVEHDTGRVLHGHLRRALKAHRNAIARNRNQNSAGATPKPTQASIHGKSVVRRLVASRATSFRRDRHNKLAEQAISGGGSH
jgi:hypothetical protein